MLLILCIQYLCEYKNIKKEKLVIAIQDNDLLRFQFLTYKLNYLASFFTITKSI